MKILQGYREFFESSDDPNLKASREKDGAFFIFSSLEAWKEEKARDEDIPAKELILDEFKRNRHIAPP